MLLKLFLHHIFFLVLFFLKMRYKTVVKHIPTVILSEIAYLSNKPPSPQKVLK